MTRELDTLTGRLSPISDAEAARLVHDREELSRRITALGPVDAPPVPRRRRRRRTMIVPAAVGAVAVAATAMVAIANVADPAGEAKLPWTTGNSPAPVSPLPDTRLVSALSFKRSHDYLEVIVKDPLADPARYRQEFAQRGLKIDLRLAPVSRAKVGAILFMEEDDVDPRSIETIIARGQCRTDGGGDQCPIGIRVPLDYRGTAAIVIGRATGPGDAPEDGGEAFAVPGEYLGVKVRGRVVSDVLADLRGKGVTVTEFRYEKDGSDRPYPHGLRPEQVEPDWYVHGVAPGEHNQPIMFVGPEREG